MYVVPSTGVRLGRSFVRPARPFVLLSGPVPVGGAPVGCRLGARGGACGYACDSCLVCHCLRLLAVGDGLLSLIGLVFDLLVANRLCWFIGGFPSGVNGCCVFECVYFCGLWELVWI